MGFSLCSFFYRRGFPNELPSHGRTPKVPHDLASSQVTKYHSWTEGSGPDGHSVTCLSYGRLCLLEIDDGNECLLWNSYIIYKCYDIILYYSILYYIKCYDMILYYIILYYIVQYYIILYYIILYYII